jgi:hypothetical protein
VLTLAGAASGAVSQSVAPVAGAWTFTWPAGPAAAHQLATELQQQAQAALNRAQQVEAQAHEDLMKP